MAILIEHTGGRWPFWLSPRQIAVCPVGKSCCMLASVCLPALLTTNSPYLDVLSSCQVSENHEGYATSVFQALQDAGLYVDVDASARTVPKRIRAAQVAQYNLIVVVGDKEKDSGTVSVRCRDASTLKSVKDALGWNDSCDKDETLVMTAAQLLDVCSKLKAAKL
jgi:threonyl-tRNA synthetase